MANRLEFLSTNSIPEPTCPQTVYLPSRNGAGAKQMKNEQLATNMQEIADNLAITTSNLNRLGLWHFLWHHEPQRTNSPSNEAAQKP